MINPYGVQREYGLWLEEAERQQGRARGLAHEVGQTRRRKEAATAELRRSLSTPPAAVGEPHRGGRFAPLELLRGLRLRSRLVRKTYA